MTAVVASPGTMPASAPNRAPTGAPTGARGATSGTDAASSTIRPVERFDAHLERAEGGVGTDRPDDRPAAAAPIAVASVSSDEPRPAEVAAPSEDAPTWTDLVDALLVVAPTPLPPPAPTATIEPLRSLVPVVPVVPLAAMEPVAGTTVPIGSTPPAPSSSTALPPEAAAVPAASVPASLPTAAGASVAVGEHAVAAAVAVSLTAVPAVTGADGGPSSDISTSTGTSTAAPRPTSTATETPAPSPHVPTTAQVASGLLDLRTRSAAAGAHEPSSAHVRAATAADPTAAAVIDPGTAPMADDLDGSPTVSSEGGAPEDAAAVPQRPVGGTEGSVRASVGTVFDSAAADAGWAGATSSSSADPAAAARAPLSLPNISVDLSDEGLGPLHLEARDGPDGLHLSLVSGDREVGAALARAGADLRRDLEAGGTTLGSLDIGHGGDAQAPGGDAQGRRDTDGSLPGRPAPTRSATAPIAGGGATPSSPTPARQAADGLDLLI